jgi:hypothetical protein
MDEARAADLLPLTIRRARIRLLEDEKFGLAVDQSLIELQNRVILNQHLVSAEDIRGGLECTICLPEFAAGEHGVMSLKCGHLFHREWLRFCFEAHHTCPICRTDIDER